MQDALSYQAPVTRSLVRLVFDRPGWPIQRFMSKRELLEALKMIVEELGSLYEAGVVHRDVSPSNLIISDSRAPGGHIIDFDHSKIAFERSEVTQPRESQDVELIASDLINHEEDALYYVVALRLLWKIHNRPPTSRDFHWPQQVYPVFLFGNHEKEEGFFTGTYQYLSPHLQGAPFHHACHDLDSLWWSVNEMPLLLAGPGGKGRDRDGEGFPQELLDKYYGGVSGKKMRLPWDMEKLEGIMAKYSYYFKDLIPLMMKWYRFVQIACRFEGYEYHHPHGVLAEMIQEAIDGLNPESEEAYKDDAEKEKKRREQDKADISEAISKQMTVGVLLAQRKPETMEGKDAAHSTISAPADNNLPPKAATPPPGQIPTVRSPDAGRVVKKLRVN